MDVWGFSSGQRQNRQQGKENIFIFSIVIKFEILHQFSPFFANIYVGRKSARSQTTFFLSQTHLLNWQLGVLGQRHGAAIILLEEPLGIYTKSGMHGGDTISDTRKDILEKRV